MPEMNKEPVPVRDSLRIDKSVFYYDSLSVPRRGHVDVILQPVSQIQATYNLPEYISTKDKTYGRKGPAFYGGFWETPTIEDQQHVLNILSDCLSSDHSINNKDYPFFANSRGNNEVGEPSLQELIAMSVRLVARYSGNHDDNHGKYAALKDVLAIDPEKEGITTKCVVFNSAVSTVCKILINEFAPDLEKKVAFTRDSYILAPDIPRTADTVYIDRDSRVMSAKQLKHGAIHIFTRDNEGIKVSSIDPYWVSRERARQFTVDDFDLLDRTFIRGHDAWLQVMTLSQATWIQLKETFIHNAKIMSTPTENLKHALLWGQMLEKPIARQDLFVGPQVTESKPTPPENYSVQSFEYYARTYGPQAKEKYRKALAELKRNKNLAEGRFSFALEWRNLGHDVRNHRDALVIHAISQIDTEYPLAVDHLVQVLELDAILSQSNYSVDSRVYDSLTGLFRNLNHSGRALSSLAVIDVKMQQALNKRLAMDVVIPPHNADSIVRQQVYEFRLEMFKYLAKNGRGDVVQRLPSADLYQEPVQSEYRAFLEKIGNEIKV